MSSAKAASDIPTRGKNLIVVAAVDGVLLFRIFDDDGKVAVEQDEKRLTEKARQIEDLRKKLVGLWPPHELSRDEKNQLIAAVTSIVGHTRTERESIVNDKTRRRMLAFAYSQMSPTLRQRHDPQDVVNSAEASANESKNSDLRDLPPEDLVRCLLQKTRIHVLNRVGHESRQMRDPRREENLPEKLRELAAATPDPAIVAEWRDLWQWVQRKLAEKNPVYESVPDLLLEGKSTAEIADDLGLSQRTVQRVLELMRHLISDLLDYADPDSL